MMTDKEVAEKFSEVDLKFHSYYKFSFSFVGIAKTGENIIARLGEDADDIYREEIMHNEKRALGENFQNEWGSVLIEDKEGNEIYYWRGY